MKISELPLATSLDGDEVVPVVQDGQTRRVPVSLLGASAPAAAVDADGGGTYTYLVQTGFTSSITKNGTGDVTLTLSESHAFGSILPVAVRSVSLPGFIAAEVSSETEIRVRTWDLAGDPENVGFHVVCALL